MKKDGSDTLRSEVRRNALAYLFQEIRYELNGIETDCTCNIGIASILKTYVSASRSDLNGLENARWFIDEPAGRTAAEYKRFTAFIPQNDYRIV